MAMLMANIADFKNNLSYFISRVEKGEEIEVCKRNIPVAKVMPISRICQNKTELGCGRGSVQFTEADLTEPFIPESSWEMHS
jgi:prevent-host-death family protein